MATAPGVEARELSLLDKVELRIALADSESKLQNVLNTYLAPLLLKLASEHLSVRNKVISICQHINTRITPPSIQLPVKALLKQFKDNPTVSLLRHFDLLYIQKGITRLSSNELADLFPVLVSGIAKDAATSALHGANLFHFLLRSLSVYKIPLKGTPEDIALRGALELTDDDATFLSYWFGKVILFRTVAQSAAMPGISKDEYDFLTLQGKSETWDTVRGGLNPTETRTRVLTLLASGAFTSQDRFLPALFASADSASRVADLGDDMLKRTLPNVDLEDKATIEKLYDIYFSYYTSSERSAAHLVPSVRVPLRTRIINVLNKSQASTTFPHRIRLLVERDLVGEGEDLSRTDREVLKLRSAIVVFLSFVSRRAAKTDLDVIAQPLIRSLQNFIEGRDANDARYGEGKSLYGSTYEIVGQLAAANEQILLQPDLGLLRWLFQSLSEEPDRDVVVSVDGALSATLRCFQGDLNEGIENALRELLLYFVKQDSRNTRNVHYAALRFANRCLPYNDAVARYIDLLALSTQNPSHDMVEEAKKGLDPYWYRLFQTSGDAAAAERLSIRSAFPDFSQLVDYIFAQNRISQLSPHVQVIAVHYARQCLTWAAIGSAGQRDIEMNTEWERKLDLAVSQDQQARTSIRKYLRSMVSDTNSTDATGSSTPAREALALLWQTAIKGMLMEQQTSDRVDCAKVVVELCTFCPVEILQDMASYTAELEAVVMSNDIELRTLGAQAYGLLSAQAMTSPQALSESTAKLIRFVEGWQTAVGADVNRAHGAAIALSSFTCHRLYASPGDATATKLLEKVLPTLLAMLDKATDPLMSQASFVALGLLCQYYVVNVQQIGTGLAFPTLLDRVMKWAKAGNEKAIHALGYLAMVLDETNEHDKLEQIIEKVFELHEIRQMETQFAVGETLACIGCGWESSAMLPTLDVDGPTPSGQIRRGTLGVLIDKTLANSTNTKPSLKKASVVWLLCFTQFCGDKPEVQGRLRKLQIAFKRCLSDRDELVQEAASRGLGLVYEKGDKSIQDELVQDLVGSFSSDRANMAGTVSEDTQLFDAGALPTGEGQSVTTYKDITNLASEVGDPSLVYRFMSLASNNAIWSSRAAFGRFGLSNVLSSSSVDGYLASNPKLYPKLYRYRFDPNSNVRRAMNDIWNALIKDTNATIDKQFQLIIEDLLLNIVGREWRVRQASCAAIADLVQGRKLEQIEPYLDRIWSLCFKVLDDIKESVRAAAAELSRVLINILLRTLESADASASSSKSLLGSVLPFLLSTQGLESSAKETQIISIHTILEIIKKAKSTALRPFLPDLVESLLGLLTSFEGEAVNYLHLNASKYNLTEQKIDEMRLTNIRGSPLMEAIERCLDLLDEQTMAALSTKIQSSMRSAVGMPSKVGCSRVLVSLSTRRNFLFKPYADTFLNLIPRYLADRNEMVSSSYAAALGYVARSASDEAILKVATHVSKLYFDSEDDRSRIVSGEIVRAIAKYATDRFASLAAAFLPIVFTARNDENSDVKQLFKETWDDNTGGNRAASLYLREIVTLANEHLTSKKWNIKHGAALALAEATEAVSAARGSANMSEAEASLLWPVLKTALAEKSWDGKERVLTGFSTFVKDAKAFWKPRSDVSTDISKIALREAGRRNAKYRPFAIATLGHVVASDGIQNPADVAKLIEALIDELTGSTDDLVEDHAESIRLREDTLASAITTLFHVLERQTSDKVLPEAESTKLFSSITDASKSAMGASQAVFTAVIRGCNLLLENRVYAPQVARLLASQATSTPAMPEDMRILHAEVMLSICKICMTDGEVDKELLTSLTQRVEAQLVQEPSQTVRLNLVEALELAKARLNV